MKNKVYSEIIHKLRLARRKESQIILFTGLFNALSVISLIVFAAIAIEAIANGDVVFRGTIAGFILFSSIMLLAYFLAPGVSRFLLPKRKPNLNVIALRVGEKYPDVKDRLCNAVQIYKTIDSPSGMSAELIEAAFKQITDYSKDKDFNVILETKKFKQSILFFLISISIFLISLLTLPNTFGASLDRIVHWDKSYLPPAPFTISLEKEQQTVIRGKPANIRVVAKGTPPDMIKLFIKEETQKNYDEYVLRLDSGNIYNYEIAATKTNVIFYAAAEWLSSNLITNIGKIKVTDLPLIRSISGKISYPKYTGITAKEFDEQSADISALAGSNVELSILSNKELKSARIIIEKNVSSMGNLSLDSVRVDTVYVQMNVKNKSAYGSFRCNFNGSYSIELIDLDMQKNIEPIKYSVVSGLDAYPSVSLVSPSMNVELSKDAILPMRIAISDDYGFSALKLHYKLIESKYSSPYTSFRTINIPTLSSNSTSQDVPFVWDLNKTAITPEDKYEFYVEVFDNDIVSGPKSARTQTITLRLPSTDEVIRQTDAVHEKAERELQKILKESETLKKDMESLNRELMKKNNQKELSWKEKKAAEDIMKKQAELKEKLSEVSKQLSDATEKLQQNNLLSQETLQKYMELQKLMSEVKSPELERMQRRLEQAMQNMDQDQLKKAMQEVKFDEERFKKSIERTMKILKRIQAEQKADALAKRAEELEQRQNELDKQTQNANPNNKSNRDELANKQEQIKNELNAINKDLKELENLMKEIGENEMPMNALKDAQDALDYNETSQDMQESSQSMQSGDFKKSSSKQKKASKKLSQFSQKMKDLKKEMDDKVNREAIRKMQKALQDMLSTSKQQEDLRGKTQKSDYNSTQVPEYAKQQSDNFESLSNIANSLSELSEKSFAVTPQMGAEITNALQKMQASVEFLANRQMSQSAQAQLEAMKSMNSSISQMQSMISQMQNQQSSCDQGGGSGQGQGQGSASAMGFQQRLQQLAAEQQAINQSMQQQMAGGSEGGSMSQEQRANMGKLADKQGRAQKSLEELAKEQKELSGGEKMALGDLNKIAQEMQEVAQDIRSGNITPETKRKQERILSRLLDAQKSLHDRDFESKRQAQSGKDVSRQSPNALDFDSFINKNQALQDLLNNTKRSYTKDYENLIRKYFEALRESNKSMQ